MNVITLVFVLVIAHSRLNHWLRLISKSDLSNRVLVPLALHFGAGAPHIIDLVTHNMKFVSVARILYIGLQLLIWLDKVVFSNIFHNYNNDAKN